MEFDHQNDTIKGTGGGPVSIPTAVAASRRITGTTTLTNEDQIVHCDTDGGAFQVNLPAGSDGKGFKIINVGSSNNAVTVNPNGGESLFGAAATSLLYDGETFDINYDSTEGWW